MRVTSSFEWVSASPSGSSCTRSRTRSSRRFRRWEPAGTRSSGTSSPSSIRIIGRSWCCWIIDPRTLRPGKAGTARPAFSCPRTRSAGRDMTDISIALDYLGRLLAKIRAVQGKEGEIISDPGSNAIDDGMTDALQDHPADPSRQEIRDEIRGLNDRQQAELVALLWLGRGDAEPEEWEA